MRHLLSALVTVVFAGFLFWGCSSPSSNGQSPAAGGSGGAPPLTCLGGQQLCNGTCVDVSANNAHCGACSQPCPGGTVCLLGGCSCQNGLTSCNDACVNTAADVGNCGACGTVCGVTQGCNTGVCTCPAGSLACGSTCVASTTDVNNCGSCGTACVAGQLCQNGTCACVEGRTSCGGSCVDTQSDPLNCGACGTDCGTQFCSMGACKAMCDPGTTACGTACVDVASDEVNCGACGTVCPAGRECTSGTCSCAGGRTPCGAECVDTMTSLTNCGACGTSCSGGQVCAAGVCGCPAGQTFCGGQCLDASSDPQHCGANCAVCGSGQVCQQGTCSCPTGQEPCSGACVPTGQCGGTGGTGGTGGAGGSSGTGGAGGTGGDAGVPPPMPVDLDCNGVNIPAADVISDFNQTLPLMYEVGSRGGTIWYSYGAEDVGTTKGTSTPGAGGNAFEVDMTVSGPCGSGGSLKASSNGNEGSSGWGVGFGVNLMQDVMGTNPPRKDVYDAQAAGYTGIGFWLRCTPEADFVYLKTVDAANDADVQNPVCSYSGGGTICNQFGIKNVTGVADWTYQKVYFAEALQDWEPATISSGSLNAAALTAFQVQVNTKYTRDGGTRVRNPFTCWVDDVHFIKAAPPRSHANVAPKTCTTGTAAPGGYYTDGNRIRDCKTGQLHDFRGMARPSFEWDRAGWNVTYEDLARIRAWGSNVVRFSLNQVFWLDAAKGPLYKRYVDRAVKWSLALGMDVILDLHWTGSGTDYGQKNMPNRQGIDFWRDVASTYKNDGRVIFELYNEPFGVSAQVWKSGDGSWAGMQEMVDVIRNSPVSANNLVLAGGLDYAYRLDEVLPAQALTGSNVAYVTHPYQFKAGNASSWDGAFGNLAATYPIVATEFGQANINQPGGTQTCDGGFYSNIINYFNSKNVSWTAWAWHVERQITNANDTCGFPQVITSYAGMTNPAGTVVKAALGGS